MAIWLTDERKSGAANVSLPCDDRIVRFVVFGPFGFGSMDCGMFPVLG